MIIRKTWIRQRESKKSKTMNLHTIGEILFNEMMIESIKKNKMSKVSLKSNSVRLTDVNDLVVNCHRFLQCY